MTGRLPIRTGIYTNYSYPLDDLFRVFMPNSAGCLPENETTVATYLGNAGYYTALVGKWHIGHNPKRNCMPTRKGFSYFYGLPYRSVKVWLVWRLCVHECVWVCAAMKKVSLDLNSLKAWCSRRFRSCRTMPRSCSSL